MRRPILRKTVSLAVPLSAGVAAAYYMPLALWFDMKEGLIAFLGFIAASLMQVMPITANFVQTDKLNPAEARRIVQSLTRQQHYWIGLLTATIITLLVIIITSAFKAPLEKIPDTWHGLSYSSACSFLIAAFFSFVLIKMVGLFEGMLSLHELRAALVMDAANKAAAEKKAAIQSRAASSGPLLPEGYGAVVDPPE